MMDYLTTAEEDLVITGYLCPQKDMESFVPGKGNTTLEDTLMDIMANQLNSYATEEDVNHVVREVENIINSKLICVVVIIGIIGNVLNLVILSHRSWQVSLGRMERFVQSGLIALAVSDMCFCITVLPLTFISEHEVGTNVIDFKLVYFRFCDGIINTFTICSTMLTVTIAVGRYFATVHPIRAREVFGMTFAKRILTTVFIVCMLVNIPRFWFQQIRQVSCLSTNKSFYYMYKNGMIPTLKVVYLCLYFIFAICIPFFVLAYCNVYLVKALRQSISSPIGQRRPESRHEQGSYRITLCLVIIVLAFFLLVVPVEIITFWENMVVLSGKNHADKYNLILAIFKCLQAVNFSFNFVLYCIVNAHFRRTIRNILGCNLSRLSKRSRSLHYESATITTGSNGNNIYRNHHFTVNVSSPKSTQSIRRTSVTEL